ncbi:MAG: type 2 isopentenyl-diphosphate Delta-isomerase [Balneolaceae bacterium]|nr:type 2 isopentenyl-diphosphate Delta-isomerase [Balneolaceae bacterium]
MMSIKQRKKDHVDLTVGGEVNYAQSTGFEDYRFVHNALPEVDVASVSTECSLLGRTFDFPLFISSMTGGYTDAGAVNAIIAEFCETRNLPFGVGSQRVMLEQPEETESFSVVREKAPTAFIAANIGGAQLIGGLNSEKISLLIGSIEANAVIVHLNSLQELMQPEGDRNFEGIEDGIGQLIEESSVPVIVKETGAGISGDAAKRLLDKGVSVIDIAGAGGTSWAKVENKRKEDANAESAFDDWGIPTVQCLKEVQPLKQNYDFELIASGGIRSSFDIIKALCLGADFAASAQPVIKAVVNDGFDGLDHLYRQWQKQAQIILTLLGCQNLSELGLHLLRRTP